MTFGSLRRNMGRKSTENEYELLRFCNKNNNIVIGGASKLFKHFLNKINPNRVISYSKNDYSNGNVYNKLGFNKTSDTKSNYYWVVNNIRENRYKWRKDVLVKMGKDASLSEADIMKSMGYYRIYDSGNMRWDFN